MSDILIALLLAIGGFWVLTVILCPLYFTLGWFKWFYHDIFKWHRPDDSPQSYDGCSIHAKCKHCGKDIMQDSQGNWFC